MVLIVFLVSTCFFLDVTTAIAASETSAGTTTAEPEHAGLVVTAPYTEDTNNNNNLLIEWGLNGINFTQGSHSLSNAPTPYSYTITGLDNGTAYQVRVTWRDVDNIVNPTQTLTNLIPFNNLIHNSLSTNSTKWGPSGWGVTNGKYGEFRCQTCHIKNSPNIKRIKPILTAPNGADLLPIETAVAPNDTVIFSDMREGSSDFGDDNGGHTSSVKICEVCHSITQYHRFNTSADPDDSGPITAQTELEHYNKADCMTCHKHADGFKPSCSSCHDYPPTTNAHSLHADTLNYSCSECHFGNIHNPGGIATNPAQFLVDYNRAEVNVAFDPAGFNSDTNNGSSLGAAFYTANGSSDQASCTNLTCHNPDTTFTGKGTDNITNNVPVWGNTISDCRDCHTTTGSFDGGAHNQHETPESWAGEKVDCVECHSKVNVVDPETSGTDSRHANKVLNIDQDNGYPVLVDADLSYRTGITAIYTDGDVGTTTMSRCSAVYCHGNFPDNPFIGKNLSLLWGGSGNVSASNCYACHWYDTQLQYTKDRSHLVHNDVKVVYEYGPKVNCETCHNYTGTHADGRVNLRHSSDGSLANTTLCDSCHGTPAAISEAKSLWRNNDKTLPPTQRISNCLYCHNSVSPASTDIEWETGNPAGVFAQPQDYYLSTGHGNSGNFNATNNSGPSYACTVCHNPDSKHIYDSSGSKRLHSVTSDGLDYTSKITEQCLDCHKTGKTAVGTLGYDSITEASIHSGAIFDRHNTDAATVYPAYGDKSDYLVNPGYQCADCHDPHGTPRLAMIKGELNGKIGGIDNQVTISGFESTDSDLTDLDPSSAPADGVCDACHATSGLSHPDTLYPDNHEYGNPGDSCIACHNHKYSFVNIGLGTQIPDQTFDFGSVAATATSFKNITVRNFGTTDVTIGTLSLPVDYAQPFSQALSGDLCSGKTLQPDASCTFGIRFAPPASGNYNDSFIIPSSDSASPATITLKGLATAPGADITVSALDIDFKSKPLVLTTDRTITIINEGSSDLHLGDIGLAVPLAAPFALVNDTCSNQILRPTTPSLYEACTFHIRFAPTTIGDFSSSLDIPSDDPDENPVTISVKGSAIKDMFAYIPDQSASKLHVIRLSTRTIDASINVSQARSAAVTADGNRVYITHQGSDSVSVIDTATNTVTATIAVGQNPYIAAISPNDAYVYITNNYGKSVSVIRTVDNTVIKTIAVTDKADGVAVSPDSSRVYVANGNAVSVIRTLDHKVIDNIVIGAFAASVAVSPDSQFIYVSNTRNDTVSVIRATDNTVIKTIAVGDYPTGLAITPNGLYVYVTSFYDGTVTAIRTSDNSVSEVISIPQTSETVSRFTGVAITPDSKYVYVTDTSRASVFVIRISDNTHIDTITGVSAWSYGKFITIEDPAVRAAEIDITDTALPTDDHGVTFGHINEGETSAIQTITITNNGDADLVVGSITLTAVPFILSADTCSGQTLVPAAICTLDIQFSPPLTGITTDYADVIVIPNNDLNENPTTVTLLGSGAVADITVDKLQVSFADRVINTTDTQIITIGNDDAADLVFSALSTVAPFSIDLTASTCDSYIGTPGLAQNESCTIVVDFSPTATGNYSEVLNVSSNDPDENPTLITLTATATITAPDIALISPYSTTAPAIDTLDFGYYSINGNYVQKILYVRNEGTENLNVGTISLAADPGPFSINQDYNLSGSTVPPLSMISSNWMSLHFSPTDLGQANTLLTIPNNDPDENPAVLNLTGFGFEYNYAFITNINGFIPFSVYYSADGTLNNTPLTRINFSSFSGISATPNITCLTSSTYSRVVFYQTSNRTYLGQIALAGSPSGVTISPDGERIFVTLNTQNQLSVLSRSQQKVLATINVGAGPWGVDITPDGNYVYIANRTDGTVSVIKTSDNSVTDTINVGTDPRIVRISQDGAYAYISNYGSNTVSIIRTADNNVTATVNVGAAPYGIAVTPDNSFVYIGNYDDNSVSVIRTSDNTLVKTISGINTPISIDATTDGRFVYAISYTDSTTLTPVSVIQTTDNTIERTFNLSYGSKSTVFGEFITANNSGPDGDGVPDIYDNCPTVTNALQTDSDGDGLGDACDPCTNDAANDSDNDGICLGSGFLAPKTGDNDNCPAIPNTDQADADADGTGDACDSCPNDPDNDAADGDGICGDLDNCPSIANADQLDSDCDGTGDACGSPVYYPPTGVTIVAQAFLADNSITWVDNFSGEDGYKIERKAEACNLNTLSFAPVVTISTGTSYNDSGLSAATDYCYRIYPFITDTCPNWGNHAVEVNYTSPGNTLPVQPTNLTPADGALDIYALSPTLTASVFSDADTTDTHNDSQWQISSSNVDFAGNLIYDSGIVAPTTSHTITASLATNATYYWRVRYRDSKGEWSPYANATSFVISNAAPVQPTNITPTDTATGITTTPTLTASAFSDSDSGDTHQSSQWLISTTSGTAFNTSIIYDSGIITGTNSHTMVGSGTFGTRYYWKVRYQDSRGDWSVYSSETSFTIITNVVPDQPINTTPAQGDVNVTRSPVLTASTFADGDGADSHQASQWLVSTASGATFAANIVYDSGFAAGSSSHTVTSRLAGNSDHYWKVRYQDSKGEWSLYSTETAFLTTSMLSLWHLDEGNGSIAYDSSGNNDATIKNGTTWNTTAGFSSNALDFDNSTDLTDWANRGVIWSYNEGLPANNFTIEAMVKATTTHQIDPQTTTGTGGTTGQKYLFGSYYRGVDGGAGVSVGTNGISVYEHGSGYMPALAVYDGTLGTGWNHIVITYTNKQPRIYLNGYLVHTGLTSTKNNVFAPFQFGGGQYGFFPGSVDEVAVYGEALAEKEILQRCLDLGQCSPADIDGDLVNDIDDNCMREYNPDQADLDGDGVGNVCDYLAYWKLDEGSGTTAVDETGGYNGTLSAGVSWSTGITGNALTFDSSDGNDSVTANNLLNNHTGDFSLSLWIKFPASTAINPFWSFGKGDAYRGKGFGFSMWDSVGNPSIPINFWLNDGTQGAFLDPEWEWPHRVTLGSSPHPRDTWGHFTWTVDRTNNVMKVYKNGVYENQQDISILGNNPVTGTDMLNFGIAASGSPYNGSLDNITVYDFVLTLGDIQARCEVDAGIGNCP